MPPPSVPITPSVLRWAIHESGLGTEHIAARVGVENDALEAWLNGITAPSRGQLKALAEVLRRPTALFFLEKPPNTASLQLNLRAAFGDQKRDLWPDERNQIRYAMGVQTLGIWSGLAASPSTLPAARFDADAEKVSAEFRTRLRIKPFQQQSWPDASAAYDKWRAALEAVGVLTLQLDLGPQAIRGFSLASAQAPLVAVNTSYSPQVRIFTLFHEVAHLITQSSSACVGFAAPTRHVNRIERWCERFAAAFLLPSSNVKSMLDQYRPHHDSPGLDEVRALSKSFHVSARAAAMRLIDLGLADFGLYREVEAHWQPFEREERRGGRGALTPLKRLRQVGKRVASGVQAGVNSGQITTVDALRYLNLSLGEFEDFSRLASAEL